MFGLFRRNNKDRLIHFEKNVLSNRHDSNTKVIDSHVTQPLKTTQKLNDFKVGNIVSLGNFVGPIEWQVLEVKDNKALLLSKHILFNMPFDYNDFGTWKTSSLRHFLNGKFYENCFTKSEKSTIIQKFNEVNSGDTEDRLYLLSVEEVNKYFNSNEEREAVDLNEGIALWWLRCRGIGDCFVAFVNGDGRVHDVGGNADGRCVGVRVALQWNLES